ncbi:MAG: hypothetical protein KDA90_21860 [Planctomycetaceae bacterium]|nr:hypothetical protein [Planctomycetaceae bacterium]
MKTLVRMLLLLALGMVGCSGRASVPPPATQEVGKVAKQSVQDFVDAAGKNPKGAPLALTVMKESLDAYLANFGDDFAPVVEEASKLQQLYQQRAPKDAIDAQLQALSAAAAALPGN